MERGYKKPAYNVAKSRQRKHAGAQNATPYFKKLIIQSLASLLVFAVIYSVKFFDNTFCRYVQNEVRYTIDYTPEFEDMYSSSKQVIKYLIASFENGRAYMDSVFFGATEGKTEQGKADEQGADIKEVITEPDDSAQDYTDTI